MYCSIRSFRSLLLALGLLVSASFSASAAVQNRISGTISGDTRVAIPNSVHGKARRAQDLGATAGNTKIEGMTLRFSMTSAQESALDQLLSDQQNPSSTSYHQWLTPEQYGAQFGLSSSDIAKVKTWLTGQGFSITEVGRSGTFVRFDGTVAQAEAAFSTSIHNLSLNGETHFGNVTDASVPAPLASVVTGVTGLHNFRLRARVHTRVVRDEAVHTNFTSSISGNHYLAPGDFYTIYNETPALTNGINGVGIKVAVMGQVDILTSDIAAFRTASGLVAFAPVIQTYGTDPGAAANCSSSTSSNCPTPNQDDLQESSLDVEWAGAAAPAATIIFVNSRDVIGTSLTDAIDNAIAPIMSISYGDCESSWGSNELNTLNQLFKQANAQGITVIGPGGDDGATDCDYSDTSATQGLAVDFPASSPYVTGMGGTMFSEGSATGATSYWSGANGTIAAGAAVLSATYSAQGYLPESVWNEDATGSTFSAGGGGVSGFFTKPAWQVGTPADASRDVPDLALNSAASHDGYLYCVNGSCTSGGFRASDGQSLTVGGGTSFATPAFAGILALIEQKYNTKVGNANPTIYALGNNSTYYNSTSSSVFHDVTSGNNKSVCTAGTPNCSSGGSIGYSAGTGYDLATGWGSVNVNALINAWNLVTPISVGTVGSSISATVVTAAPTSVTAGSTVTFTATVTGGSGTPTGTVQFLLNNAEVGSAVTLNGGVATYTYTSSCSGLGQMVVTASYSGDATYAGSKGSGITAGGSSTVSPVQVTVSSGSCPDFSITPSASTVTVTTGSPSATITVASVNSFAGTVTFTASATESGSTIPTLQLSPTSVTLAAGGNGTTTLSLPNVTAQLRSPALPGRSGKPWYMAGSGVTLAALVFFGVPRRRRLGALLLVAVSFAVVGGTTGCGGSNNTIVKESGTYTVTVTATYTGSSNSTISHSTTVVFNVQ